MGSIGDLIAQCRFVIGLSLAITLVACTHRNRIVTVECGVPPGIALGASVEDSFEGPRTLGLMNSHPFSPGVLLELSPAAEGRSAARLIASYTVKVSTSDLLPPRQDSSFWNLSSAELSLKFEVDHIENGVEERNSLADRIARNTTAVVDGSERVMLRDPLALLNADERAQQFVRAGGAQSRFVMVTGLLYGDRIDLVGLNYSNRPEIAVNTVTLRDVYLHYKFSCSTIDSINAKAQLVGKAVPVASIYRSVRFLEAGKITWYDRSPPDLSKYSGI